jgi:hypothetical protein
VPTVQILSRTASKKRERYSFILVGSQDFAPSLNRARGLTLIGTILAMTLWAPIGYTGLPRTQEFSTHSLHLIDAGIVSYQPWTDQNGAVHPFREYGEANLQWNTSNIVDGYQVESYNFSNIPNVVAIDWDFHGLIAKVQNGVPVYEDLFPNINGPVYPFDGTNFQMTYESFKSYHAQWLGNTTVYYADPAGNITYNLSSWPDANDGVRSQIETNVTQVLQELPRTGLVAVNFTANWDFRGVIFSRDAGLYNYDVGFERIATVSMVVENETVLNAAGSFYVHTADGEPVQITYRTIPVTIAEDATLGIIITAAVVCVIVFRKELRTITRFFLTDKSHTDSSDASIQVVK